MRALIVEDDKKIAGIVCRALEAIGFEVTETHTALKGVESCFSSRFDIIILDLMLPDFDGLELISRIRLGQINTPVLVLSAKRSVEDRVQALRQGGDDFLMKPFSTEELTARAEALVRRSQTTHNENSTKLNVGDVTVDLVKREVFRAGRRIDLQLKEFVLLEFLMRHQGKVVSKAQVLQHVWNYEFDPQTNVVDVLMFRLRGKLDKDFDAKMIQTVRGTGYVFKAE